eukprot:6509943-Alexandrium_andersonii.AAC.1
MLLGGVAQGLPEPDGVLLGALEQRPPIDPAVDVPEHPRAVELRFLVHGPVQIGDPLVRTVQHRGLGGAGPEHAHGRCRREEAEVPHPLRQALQELHPPDG